MQDNPSALKLCFAADSASRLGGGVSVVVRSLSRAMLTLRPRDVSVVALEDARWLDDHSEWEGVPVTVCKVVGPRTAGYSPHYLGAIRGARPDVVHVHGLWTYKSVAAYRWKRRNRGAYVVSPHGMLGPWPLQNSQLRKRVALSTYEGMHLRNARAIHALTAAEAADCRSLALKTPIAVIPNGVDLPALQPMDAPEWAAATERGRFTLLYLSRLHPGKGLPELIDAWKSVASKNTAWQLVIAGWGAEGYVSQLKRKVLDTGLGGSVIFVGPQLGMRKHATFLYADAFILPSCSEALPMAVLEAWSYALPVIQTQQCNLPEGVRAGAAIEIQPDSASIAGALRTLFDMTPEQRALMGAQGRALVERQFTWQSVAARMDRLYQWARDGGAYPSELEWHR